MARVQQIHPSKSPAGVNAAPPVAAAGVPAASVVAARAYELWQQSGRPHGRDQEFWFQAERELRPGKNAR